MLAVTGLGLVVDFDVTPGNRGEPPQQWPAGTAASPNPDRPTLLMFAHPRCPCTRASLAELGQVLAACPGAVETRVFFRTPAHPTGEWAETPLWNEAAKLPQTTVLCDPDGEAAKRFEVKTSGHVLLYGSDGRLLFSGGITGSRGHEGDNPGRSSLVSLLSGKSTSSRQNAVFGCSLFEMSQSQVGKPCQKP